MKKSQGEHKDSGPFHKKPNFLILMVDQERYPVSYEGEELKKWRRKNLVAQELLKRNGFEFTMHYAGSTACSPSRTTFYTGQYPSLHGVTQTSGAAKTAFDPDMFWLDQNTVPTFGDYFRTAGYRTYWKGKWHASNEDIIIPGTKNAFPSYTSTGVPDPESVKKYRDADRLNPYGFSGWVGPEPHGSSPRNSGSSAAIGLNGRDAIYAEETIDLLHSLEKEEETSTSSPWLIMCSFVNPHDIALFGTFSELSPLYDFNVDPSVPDVPPAPTAKESLHTKPTAQESYRITYQEALQPLRDSLFYRRLYYSLQKQADQDMLKVFQALQESCFYDDTIVIFLSDHGELLGAHGGLFQKWYNTYEESIHVPLIIHNPKLFPERSQTDMITSHIDLLPTMLGLAGIDPYKAQRKLRKDHTEVHPLVGRDLTPLLQGDETFFRSNEPIYFMSDDDFTRGPNQVTAAGRPYTSVVQPNHTEAIITRLSTGKHDTSEVWKLTRYFDNPQFWSNPDCEDVTTTQVSEKSTSADTECSLCITKTKKIPVPEQYELYNLTADPLEEKNLAYPEYETPESIAVKNLLISALEEQCRQKRLYPTSGDVPGKPSCNCK
ncbi:sulfatase-like hydrolase/transferase [Rossellomorea aquimaris]|uniref:sulfatase-like hydrolase/transferase n=1 Tax=Rossellomorea aquimaris TaxID=189382 RepID=UPI001CD3DF0E|nr:sulfatase-like hydrolase/transferase [Rossellomorea aquimaris]MCA1055842.1 sulfatase-like hydrolase/transferase [Rossellomorea aquimaris]